MMDEVQLMQPPQNMPNVQQDDGKTTRWKIDPEDVIDEIEHYLRGDNWDSLTGTWRKNKNDKLRLVNEEGISVITTHLRGVLNKNIILSNFDNEMILQIAKQNAHNVKDIIFTSYDKYEIKKENFSMILQLIDGNVYGALLRAKGGFFVNHLSTTQRYIEQNTLSMNNGEQKKKGILPNVFGWGGDR